MIKFCENEMMFRLRAKDTDYVMKVVDGYLLHVYYGNKVGDDDLSYLLRLDEYPHTPSQNPRDKGVFMDCAPFEFPCFGVGDYRESALKVRDSEGMSACDMKYVSHRIFDGKPKLEGMPATFSTEESPAQTLEITMSDDHTGLKAILVYSVFDKLNVITRSVRLENSGEKDIRITRALSCCVDFDDDDMDMVTLNGSWGRERHIERCRLHKGKQGIASNRGISSHQSNPFAALCTHNADEDSGEVFGFNLVYSGNFFAQAEDTQFDKTRFVMGLDVTDFEWVLGKGEVFTAPEVVMVHSDEGFGKMSRTFHDLYRSNLIRSPYKDVRRPVLINNWEATYFDFDAKKLISIAEEAAKLGIEMLVIDDGWFGHRDTDNSSLGDWFVYEKKLGCTLGELVSEVNKLGMKVGLWFEPEMVCPDSELFRAHPDWAIQIQGRDKTLCRDQCVLDYSRKEVRDYVYSMMDKVLKSANIEYIKWDMNRPLTEIGSACLGSDRQGELAHRYVLGVYELMERLTSEHPDILLENCSSGGGRFDAGMLYYSPQIWCSDNADAVSRLKIQHGTSMCYPCMTMGAHVSDCPNHTVGRNTPFDTRGNIALSGTFGYELDVTKISEEDRNRIPQQIEQYKKYEALVRKGDYYRIGNMFEDNSWDAWEFVAKDKSEVMFCFVQVISRANYKSRRIKLKGLDSDAMYYEESEPDILISGKTLMNAGINIAKNWGIDGIKGDFASKVLHYKKRHE